MCGVVSPEHRADQQRQRAADREEERDRAQRARRGRAHTRAATSADARGQHDQDRLEDEPELGHAEVELGLEGGQADQQAAGAARSAQASSAPGSRRALGRASPLALDVQHGDAHQRHRAAPPISIRWVGPHRVTSWPNRRCQTSSSGKPISAERAAGADQHAAERRVPVLGRCGSPPAPGRPCGSTIAMKPAEKMPNSPARMK